MDQEAIELELLRREIAKRLRSVCVDVPADQFQAYVAELARLQRGYQLLSDLEGHTEHQHLRAEQT
jgi:hypothetical protein